jgi:UDP-glucose 4-epimerase
VDVAEAVTLLIEAERPNTNSITFQPALSGRRCSGGRSWLRCIPASFADWPKPVKHRRSTCIVPPTGRRLRSRALRKSSGWRARFGCADSAADLSVWWTEHRGET